MPEEWWVLVGCSSALYMGEGGTWAEIWVAVSRPWLRMLCPRRTCILGQEWIRKDRREEWPAVLTAAGVAEACTNHPWDLELGRPWL